MSVEWPISLLETTMPCITLGPIELRFNANASGVNWTDVELAFITDRNQAGFAARETALRAGFKSEHALEILGEDDTTSTAVLNGTTYHGKRIAGADGQSYVLTAEQVAAKAEYVKAMRQSKLAAQQAAQFAKGIDPSILVDAAVTAEA
jgi:hypothetical protein